jgi:peptidoglycan-N-acetylglucosamine deacetylase
MNRKWSRVSAWMLVMAMVVTMTACGANDDKDQAKDDKKQEGKVETKSEKKKKMQGDNKAADSSKANQTKQKAQSMTGGGMHVTPSLLDGYEDVYREPHPLTLTDLRRKYPSTLIMSGVGDKRQVALTFDDAPDNIYTPRVLDVLKKEGVKATFFCVGNRIEAHPDVVRRMVAEGHVLGNHSYSHPNLPKLTDAKFREEIRKTDQLIMKYAGYAPSFVRPPYGNISEGQIQWLASQHRKVVNWNIDSLDWKGLSRDQVAVNVLSNIKPNAIILQHSGIGAGGNLDGTVEALPEIIAKLKKDNVKFVTVPGMIGIP